MQTRKIGDDVLLLLSRGDIIPDAVIDAIKKYDIKAAVISGIGALEEIELGYFNIESKVYEKKIFKGSHELISLTGNLGWVEDEAFLHFHAAVSGADMNVFGGHLFRGIVSVTGEIVLKTLDTTVIRDHDEFSGLKLWKL